MFRYVTRMFGLFAVLASAAQAQPPLAVEFIEVSNRDLSFETSLTGTLEARESVDLGFRQGGRVVEVLVEAGDRVAAGQPLARTDPVQQDQALSVARAGLSAAEASRAQAQQAFDRATAMLSRGVGTRAARDQAQQALSQAEGAVRRASSKADQAKRAVEDTVLRAPEASVVTARNADPGQIVGAAQPVISLATVGGVDAVFQAAETLNLDKALGAEVALRTIDVDAPDMTGHVAEISPLVDPVTGAVTLRVRVDEAPTDTGLLGTAVRGSVSFPAGAAISVPWTALTRDGDAPAVWVVDDDNSVELVRVSISRFANDSVLLNGGLTPGQIVVGAGSQLLYPGRLVVNTAELGE